MKPDVSREESRITLASGARLRIRPLRRGEGRAARELFARLSLPTRYLRFFLPGTAVPDSLVQIPADVDDPWRIALVAESNDGRGDVVALGNVTPAEEGRGEVGLVVADEWQRLGIGRSLADRLLKAADARGYHEFVVHSLAANPAVRPLLWHVAEITSTRTRYGVSEIAFVRRWHAEQSARANSADDVMDKAYERMIARWRAR